MEIADDQTIILTHQQSLEPTGSEEINKKPAGIHSPMFLGQNHYKRMYLNISKECCENFFGGDNSLIFTFGTTCDGKMYTIQGTGDHPGLIPRALCMIFKTIRHMKTPKIILKLTKVNDAIKPSKEQIQNQKILKESILFSAKFQGILASRSSADVRKRSYAPELFSKETAMFRCMEKVLDEETEHISPDNNLGNFSFSFWVSFAEVYNECI